MGNRPDYVFKRIKCNVAQWKSARLITGKSVDRNHPLLDDLENVFKSLIYDGVAQFGRALITFNQWPGVQIPPPSVDLIMSLNYSNIPLGAMDSAVDF